MKEEVLKEIGFSKNQAKVYLALLDLGSATANRIADKSKVHRTNVYDTLKGLIKKGLVTYVFKDKIRYYQATDPKNLINLLKEKELHLLEILPQLSLTNKMTKTKPRAKIYEGMAAFKLFCYDILKYKDEITIFGIPKRVPNLVKHWIDNYHREHARQKILMTHIYNSGAKERIKYLNTLPYCRARSLPKQYDSPVSTFVCGDEVVLVMWDIDPLLFVRINNRALADSYKKYFSLMWKIAKE